MEEKKTLVKPSQYQLPEAIAAKVERKLPNVVFLYHGEKVDLRKATEKQILAMAAANDCPVLQLKGAKPDPKASAPEATSSGDDKETSSAKKK